MFTKIKIILLKSIDVRMFLTYNRKRLQKKIEYKYGSDCRNLSPWRMKITLSMKWETWEVTAKE